LERNKADDRKVLSHLDLVVDLENRTVTKAGKPVDLTLKEYELLELLIKNPKKVFGRRNFSRKSGAMITWGIPGR